MKIPVRYVALALSMAGHLLGVVAWGDSGEIHVKSRLLAAPRRVDQLSKGFPRLGPQAAPEEHIQPRVNAPALEAMGAANAVPMAAVTNPPTSLQSATDAKIKILLNRALGSGETGQTGLVSEPAAAARGNLVLLTANAFASFTDDVGSATHPFQPIDPGALFGASRHGAFCCDQSVVYDKKRDLLIWLLQYRQDLTENVLRIAVSQGRDIDRRVWYVYELSPRAVDGWNNHYFDFSSLTIGKSYLYVTTDLVATEQAQSPERGVVLRLPLDRMARHQALTYDFFSVGSVVELRATEGATNTMYWGGHLFLPRENDLRVYSWPEGSRTVSFRDSKVGSWNPVGRDDIDFDVWLGRIDPAITAGWMTSGKLGFAWTAGKDALHPRPHIRVAIMDAASGNIVDDPHIWSQDLTFAYPAAAPNSQGVVGITLQYNGDSISPSHAVGVLRGSNWSLVSTKNGDGKPENSELWGDYLSIQPDGSGWLATGYTLQGGRKAENVQNLVVRFETQ
jgi:hypothetical protein